MALFIVPSTSGASLPALVGNRFHRGTGGNGGEGGFGDRRAVTGLRPASGSGEKRAVRVLSLLGLVATGALAQDAYEIQVYDSEVAKPQVIGFELHTNLFVAGASVGVSHFTLEPHVGLARWCEVGAYFQTVRSAEGAYDFAGVKGRFKMRWPEKLFGFLGLSFNTEVSFGGFPPSEGVAVELRPIVDADFERLYLSVNPIVGLELSGEAAGQYGLEPAFKVGVKLLQGLMLGAEYYAAFGTQSRGGPLVQAAQRLFGAFDAGWKAGETAFALNAGVGYGFVGPERVIVKLTVAVDFE